MFCENCGGVVHEGSAFCPGCGAKTGEGVTAQTPPIQIQTTKVRDFRCNNCGAPLKIPTNSSAPVRCPSCKTECLIEKAIKNAELAAKENIESGIPLTATSAKLHRAVISVLAKSPAMPLDVFEKVEIILEERYCVPAYVFHCNGTESFNYEVGNERSQTYTVNKGDSVEIREKTRTEWTPSNGTASVRKIIVAAGNKDLAKQVQGLYANLDTKKLIDIEDLIFPTDVNTSNSNLPLTSAFNEFAVPVIESELKIKAEEQIAKQTTTGLSFGGATIQKETVRIFLGMYRIVFRYEEKEHSIWVSGDGSRRWWNEGVPEDSTQKLAINNIKQDMDNALSAVPVPTTTIFTIGLWGSIVGGIIIALNSGFVWIVIGIIGAIVCGVMRGKVMDSYNEQCSEIKAKFDNEIGEIKAASENVVQQFKNKKQPLRGIYQNMLAGDESAF